MLVDRFNVHVNAGSMYGEAGEGFIRINLACPRELLDEGLKRIADGLSSVLYTTFVPSKTFFSYKTGFQGPLVPLKTFLRNKTH